jgi:hypothetical protein
LKKIFIILFTLLLSTGLSGQRASPDSLSLFSGYALYAVDSAAIPNVHVLNLSKGTGTISGLDGSFELLVRDADTLKFSCIGLRDHYIHINALLLRPELLVFLLPDTIMMDEVRISPLPSRRFFRYVFLDTRISMEKSAELNLGPLLKRDPGNIPATGIHFSGPVQLLYNAFNKKAVLDRKLRKNRKKYSKYLVPEGGDSLIFPDK